MVGKLKEYVIKLWEEYDKAMINHFESELMENRDLYYKGQTYAIRMVIDDLYEILNLTNKEIKELFKKVKEEEK